VSDTELFYLKTDGTDWKKVSKEEFVRSERSSGFYNTLGQPDEPATSGFSSGSVSGRSIDTNYAKPEQYDWDPEFRKVVWPEENHAAGK
jgi:hypothetical protein